MLVYGEGVINTLINKLPFEIHIPQYEFCGPGTRLDKRLARGDKGINPLDAACRTHDIAYRDYKDLENRHRADKVLEDAAWNRFKSQDASFGEKTSALAVTAIMKTKRKLGMGVTTKKQNKKRRCGGKIPFKSGYLRKIENAVKKSSKGGSINAKDVIRDAIGVARRIIKEVGGKKKVIMPRVIPVPKQGGILPLIPIFAGLSALGGLAGGVSSIVRAVNSAKEAKKQQDEGSRHNKMMEAIAMGKKGSALYLKPYKTGSALYLTPKN